MLVFVGDQHVKEGYWSSPSQHDERPAQATTSSPAHASFDPQQASAPDAPSDIENQEPNSGLDSVPKADFAKTSYDAPYSQNLKTGQ